MAKNLLILFMSTYISEQTFSTIKLNKSKLRSTLTDSSLRSAALRLFTSNILPDFKQLFTDFNYPQLSY